MMVSQQAAVPRYGMGVRLQSLPYVDLRLTGRWGTPTQGACVAMFVPCAAVGGTAAAERFQMSSAIVVHLMGSR
jgi:hypothetical protein